MPVAIKPPNLASETPTVCHGRELPAVSRDVVACSQWLREEAARQGYAWRQRGRAQQLCSLRAACVPPNGVVGGEALRLAPLGAGVLVETLRELATRGKRTSTSGKSSGEGFGARVAVRPVLEDHETAILELERVVWSIEDRISELERKVVLTGMKAEFELFRHATLSHCNDTKWQTLEVFERKVKQLTDAIMLTLLIPSRVLSTRWRHALVTGACSMTASCLRLGTVFDNLRLGLTRLLEMMVVDKGVRGLASPGPVLDALW